MDKQLSAFKKVMDSVFKERGEISSLIAWGVTIRLKRYPANLMKEAFERYVDVNDYHPSEKKSLLNFGRLRMMQKNNSK